MAKRAANMAPRIEIGRRLVAAREALGLSQVDVCAALGVSTPRWNQWEKGTTLPDALVMAELARRYGVTTDWVYVGNPAGLPYSIASKLLKAAS